VPDAAAKRSILNAVAHATKAIPLAVALRMLRLSAARYHECFTGARIVIHAAAGS
jgi:hypothetical protein